MITTKVQIAYLDDQRDQKDQTEGVLARESAQVGEYECAQVSSKS